jgi:hypothetical protein
VLESVARELDPELQPTAIVTGVGLREFSMNGFLTQWAVAARLPRRSSLAITRAKSDLLPKILCNPAP